jgi:hypothetical protein
MEVTMYQQPKQVMQRRRLQVKQRLILGMMIANL